MNRFLYYLIFLNMMAIITTPIPKLLMNNSSNGAISSMVLSIALGVGFIFIIVRFFQSFPGRDLTELMKSYVSPWFRISVTIYFIIMWYVAGLTSLVTLTFLLITFLSPEMSIYVITISILITVFFGVLLKGKSVLFAVEFVIILLIPITLLLFVKLYTSQELEWDQIRVALMHSVSVPNYNSFNASAFMFTGCTNLVVFNRYFKKNMKSMKKPLIVIGLSGLFMLATTYLIPMGYNGFDQVENLVFPWTTAADSVRMKFGIVERVVFIFMLLFVAVSFLSIIVHWHVANELIKSLGRIDKWQFNNGNVTPYVSALLFVVIGVFITAYLTQYQLYHYSSYFYNIFPLFIVVWLITIWSVKRGARA